MGYTRGDKLQIYPTNLAHPSPLVICKAMGWMAGDGFVECVGLWGGFFGGGVVTDRAFPRTGWWGNTELVVGKLKNRKGFSKPNFELGPN
jgi:hypothetical protein